MTVMYTEWTVLQTRGAVNPGELEEVEGTLLVGNTSVLAFDYNHNGYGYDSATMFPTFHNGVRAWLRRDVWCPGTGYSASGTTEWIITFEDGVKLFLERGVFQFPMPDKQEEVQEHEPERPFGAPASDWQESQADQDYFQRVLRGEE